VTIFSLGGPASRNSALPTAHPELLAVSFSVNVKDKDSIVQHEMFKKLTNLRKVSAQGYENR
jgi:hypothetical protein